MLATPSIHLAVEELAQAIGAVATPPITITFRGCRHSCSDWGGCCNYAAHLS